MSYRRFEELVIALGVGAVSAALLLSIGGGITAQEIMPELLLLGVLVGAVHWGRRGGFIAAAVASLIDVAYSVPMLMNPTGTDWGTVGLLVARLSAYGIVGILGGEICVRVRHAFLRLEHEGAFDEWSSLYNQRFFGKQLDVAMSRCERYSEPAAVVLLTIAASGNLRPSRQHALVREVAAELLDGVRNADVVARLDDGRFALLLPHTPRRAAETVASRVRTSVRLLVSVPDDALAAVVLGAPEDLAALRFLVKQCLRDEDGQDPSGAYSAAGSSTRKPAEESTSSAPAASTLNMSTAAVPDGSTKQ
jgi:diguanylate cyclase (GGDEF)-like protein